MRYFESKQETYSNNKYKLYFLLENELWVLHPYKHKEKNGISYGLSTKKDQKPKIVNEDILKKYYKELTKKEYWEKEITHIPTNY